MPRFYMLLPLLLFFSFDFPLDLEPLGIYDRPAMAVSDQGAVCLVRGNTSLVFLQGKQHVVKGGEGQGPGEFQWISAVQWVAEANAFAVLDDERQRVSWWDASGALQKETALFYSSDPEITPGFADNVSVFYDETKEQIRLANFKNQTVRDLHSFSYQPGYTVRVPMGRGEMTVSYLWDARMILRNRGSATVVCFTGQERLKVFDWDKVQPLKTIALTMKRIPTTDDDEAQARESLKYNLKRKTANFQRPDFWPVISDILFDARGRIWVFGSREPKGYAWHLLDVSGKKVDSGMFEEKPVAITDKAYALVLEQEDWVLKTMQIPD